MPYPQMLEYNEAVQHPAHSFVDPELKQASIKENNLGLPVVMSGGFALTYTLTTARRKYAVRCFHREIPSIEQKYNAISKTLRSVEKGYFVDFDFQKSGIKVGKGIFPIVKMDWVEGDPLGIWLDKQYQDSIALDTARTDFLSIACFLEREGIAHGDIQNGNVMMSKGRIKLIDYDGMFVPGLPQGNGSEVGHKHFQHPDRRANDYGPTMDRFSFIALDLSLQAVIEDKSLYPRFRDGGETIVFKANDFADPENSEIFRLLLAKAKLRNHVQNFGAICEGALSAVPTLEEFIAGRNIPRTKTPISVTTITKVAPRPVGYISAFPVVDALNYSVALPRVGDKIELIGKIVEVKPGVGRYGRGRGMPYIFINFGPWRGNIVKISVWSEGLTKLKEKPSNVWVGRWVSVTGLLDPPYESKKYGYSHLSITVEEDGQIQQLDEAQARFRLASIGKPTPLRNRDLVKDVVRGSGPSSRSATPTSTTSRPAAVTKGTQPSRNRDIVNKFKQGGQQTSPTPSATSSPVLKQAAVQHRSQGAFDRIPVWLWVVGGIIVLLLLLGKH
jgi:hypothetical protein